MDLNQLRNVAVIAHVDHGKTTMTDKLLYQSGQFRTEELDKLAGGQHDLILDSNDQERERGITILAKNCSMRYIHEGVEHKINLIDTPGHADFGGEVERVLKLADGVLLLVDSYEGPMPQTRFVLQKALSHGLKPIVVVNKIDRPDARPDDVVNEIFDLLVELDAPDDALDFPTLFASGKDGWASHSHTEQGGDLKPLLDTIIEKVPAPDPAIFKKDQPLQMLVTSLDFSDYVGLIAIGRVFSGEINPGSPVRVFDREGKISQQKTLQVLAFDGLGRTPVESVQAGDLCAIVGLEPIGIGDTIGNLETTEALPRVTIDEPTLTMTFQVNNSPFAGQEGEFVTSRQIKARLEKELRYNVALRVEPGASAEQFIVSGRGLLHLGVLIETMRREGFELAVGKPKVLLKEINGKMHEPIEELVIDCPEEHQSSVMSLVGNRGAIVESMDSKAGTSGYVHMVFSIPSRSLLGLRTRMLTATQGTAIMHHTLKAYEPLRTDPPKRAAGVLIATEAGQATGYALSGLYDRGIFFVDPGEKIYAGQVIGESNKDKDLDVNVLKAKQLSAVRVKNKDDNLQIKPARKLSMEACLEYIEEDELVEITPQNIRIRKRMLAESDRRRISRQAKAAKIEQSV